MILIGLRQNERYLSTIHVLMAVARMNRSVHHHCNPVPCLYCTRRQASPESDRVITGLGTFLCWSYLLCPKRWRRGVVVTRWSRSTRLALGWVTVSWFDFRRRHFISVCNQPPRSTQPSTLSGTVKWVPAKGRWFNNCVSIIVSIVDIVPGLLNICVCHLIFLCLIKRYPKCTLAASVAESVM